MYDIHETHKVNDITQQSVVQRPTDRESIEICTEVGGGGEYCIRSTIHTKKDVGSNRISFLIFRHWTCDPDHIGHLLCGILSTSRYVTFNIYGQNERPTRII